MILRSLTKHVEQNKTAVIAREARPWQSHKFDITLGDCHVASLLAMTVSFEVLQCY